MKPLSQAEFARLDELLADQALTPLDPAEQEELERLLERAGGEPDVSFDRAAAAVDLALAGGRYEPVPPALLRAIERDARRHFDQVRPGPRAGRGRILPWLGWAAAAGLVLYLAVDRGTAPDERSNGRLATLQEETRSLERRLATSEQRLAVERQASQEAERSLRAELARLEVELERERALLARRAAEDLARREGELLAQGEQALADQASAFGKREQELLDEITGLRGLLEDLDPAALRRRLLSEAPDLVRMDWTATEDPLVARAGVHGDVVWSPSRQEGYMTFRNLPANLARERQYQLWIFDGSRDAAMPVDGGVFDIPTAGEWVTVPIRAGLTVRDLEAFAVTLEPAGGVVVSRREHLLLLAGL